MRILTLGSFAIPKSKFGEQWQSLLIAFGGSSGNRIGTLSKETPNVLDYDVFIIDAGKVEPESRTAPIVNDVTDELHSRISGGGCLICFVSANRLQWLPHPIGVKAGAGQRFEDAQDCSDFKELFQRFKNDVSLLWYEGFPLENVLAKALGLLGIPAKGRPPVDLVHVLADSRELFIEVEGTKGPIKLDKGQQLLSYMAQTDDPASKLGAIIGNPFRTEHPSARPPAVSQAPLFVTELDRLAKKQGWPLITTSQVFDWVRRHLDGDKSAALHARSALGVDIAPTLAS